jgi:hypothetical protein
VRIGLTASTIDEGQHAALREPIVPWVIISDSFFDGTKAAEAPDSAY